MKRINQSVDSNPELKYINWVNIANKFSDSRKPRDCCLHYLSLISSEMADYEVDYNIDRSIVTNNKTDWTSEDVCNYFYIEY